MEKITAWLENGSNTVYLDDSFIKTTVDSKIVIKNVSIYWKFSNVHQDNYEVTLVKIDGSQTVLQFGTGYWSFDMISERLKLDNVSLTKNRHNGTCRIHSSKYEIHLGNFGLLLGFVKDTVITRGTKVDSGEVDVNSGLRLVTIGCDIVNQTKNFNPDGKRSKTIAAFPITTEEPIFNYISFYKNVNFEAPVNNGIHNRLIFYVGTNIEDTVEMNILTEFYFK